MAYENFIPEVEIAGFLEDKEPALVFGALATRKYEGAISKQGDTIKLKTIGTPTVYTVNKNTTYSADEVGTGNVAGTGRTVVNQGIPNAEEVGSAEIELQITQVKVFNYFVGDLDQQLVSEDNLVGKLRINVARQVAIEQDQYIAAMLVADTRLVNPEHSSGAVITTNDSDSTNTNPTDLLDSAVQTLNERDIPDTTPLVAVVSPKFWTKLKKSYIHLDTDNSMMLGNRKCGMYNGIKVVKSNNVTVSSTEYVFVMTEGAYSFAEPLTKVEAYRPEAAFADAVKGMTFYDSSVIRPKEILTTVITYAAIVSA